MQVSRVYKTYVPNGDVNNYKGNATVLQIQNLESTPFFNIYIYIEKGCTF